MSRQIYILEDGGIIDIPEQLLQHFERFYSGEEYTHYNMSQRFYPNNRTETAQFFMNIKPVDILLTYHVFVDFQYLELMIELFSKIETPLTLKIMNPSLGESLSKFMEEPYSSIDDGVPENKRRDFKKTMNDKFVTVLSKHNIFWICRHGELRIDSPDVFEQYQYSSDWLKICK